MHFLWETDTAWNRGWEQVSMKGNKGGWKTGVKQRHVWEARSHGEGPLSEQGLQQGWARQGQRNNQDAQVRETRILKISFKHYESRIANAWEAKGLQKGDFPGWENACDIRCLLSGAWHCWQSETSQEKEEIMLSPTYLYWSNIWPAPEWSLCLLHSTCL